MLYSLLLGLSNVVFSSSFLSLLIIEFVVLPCVSCC